MFNNQIYGLTKGQYSPTSERGKVTGTSPQGSIDRPINPIELALSAGATFVARTLDRDQQHMAEIFKKAAAHRGGSFIEVYQNCNIFNDGAFFHLTEKDVKDNNVLYLKDNSPLLFGNEKKKAIRINGTEVEIVKASLSEKNGGLTIFQESSDSSIMAYILAQLTYKPEFPTPVGVFYKKDVILYENELKQQIETEIEKKGSPSLDNLLNSGHTWTIE
jgi:2-oxoglutarate ferredoxin oxidoreductase subunit beta